MKAIALAVIVTAAFLIENADATTIGTTEYKCPVGGEAFTAASYRSLFLYGYRPDGRPLGTARGWLPYPECPSNRLIVYREFTPDEIRRLNEILKSDTYKNLLASESQFYRAAWLEKALRLESEEYVWLLLQATWYVDREPEKKTRYRKAFLDVAERVPVDANDLQSVLLRLRVLNSYREQGEFDRVVAGLDALPIGELSYGLPENVEAAIKLDEEGQQRWVIAALARDLRRIAERRDKSVDPIEMLPDWMADEECFFREPKTDYEKSFCSEPERAARIERDREMYEADNFWSYEGPISAPPPPPRSKSLRRVKQ